MIQEDKVNSNYYWDHRFKTDWETNGGKEQSRFFARIAIEEIPLWLVHAVRWNKLTVCDWGCAQGDGTEAIAQILSWDMTGIDFSAAAIAHAKMQYSQIKFSHENLLDAPERPPFDVLFSSNTLEHFPDPWNIFNKLTAYASRFIVLLLPYREFERHAEHDSTFDATNIPIAPNANWSLVHSSVVDTRSREPSYWLGEQVLLIYANTVQLVAQQFSLADTSLHDAHRSNETALLRQQLTQAHSQAIGHNNLQLVNEQWQTVLAFKDVRHASELAIAREVRQQNQLDADAMQIRFDAEKNRADVATALKARSELKANLLETQIVVLLADIDAGRAVRRQSQLDADAMQSRFDTEKNRGEIAIAQTATLLARSNLFETRTVALLVEIDAARELSRQSQLAADATQIQFDAEKNRADVATTQTATFAAKATLFETQAIALLFELNTVQAEYQQTVLDADVMQDQFDAETIRADSATAQTVKLKEKTTLYESQIAALLVEIDSVHKICQQNQLDAMALQNRLDVKTSCAETSIAQTASSEAKATSFEIEVNILNVELEKTRRKLQEFSDKSPLLVAVANQASERVHFLQYREQLLMKEVQILLATKSWKITAPLRMMYILPQWTLRRFQDVKHAYVHGGVRSVVYRSLMYLPRRQQRRAIRPITPIPFAKGLASSTGGSPIDLSQVHRTIPDVFVFSIIDWHFRIQRPQHLAREFARAGHRVYYFSNHFEDAKEPGFSIEHLDETLPLYQIKLKVNGAPAIYFAAPTTDATTQILAGIKLFREWSDTNHSYSVVQHGYWYPMAIRMQSDCLTYDCMDHHEGFGNVPKELLDIETQMMRRADLLVATSTLLEEHALKYNRHVEVIRNAGQYADFCDAPAKRYKDPHGRQIIGYYGAIAEWLDAELVARVAQNFPDSLILMVGADTAGVGARLSKFSNVEMTGEVPYKSLPYYLYAFDVCMLPFKVIPLTLATNPVKVYEYLGAGRSVVSIDLPEMKQFGELVRLADTHDGFITQIKAALSECPDINEVVSRRKAFASGQTWAHRVKTFEQTIEALPLPKVSVIVLTYNNLALTKDCLDSLVLYSDGIDLEIVVVDNASSDGSPAYLSLWAASRANVKLILNHDNHGFSAGNNLGLAVADGDYLVILNNDTVVTRGWARRMVNHLRNAPEIGVLGPLTNNIGNEARIDTVYATLDEMHSEALSIIRPNIGNWSKLNTVAFFCTMMPRSTYERCGPLCEDYGIGFFEDDDYCRRVQLEGLVVGCADDVFVHHHLSASFNKLGAEKKQALFDTNRAIYEKKWGAWVPHRYRVNEN